MSADPIIYCLERLTDYRQFERLASDVMATTDYPGIEPIGGSGDGGRDALHKCQDNGTTTIFTYSVRNDWQTKIRSDCRRIEDLGHTVDRIVFVSAQIIGASQRDKVRADLTNTYGWELEYFDLERLRVLLTGPLQHLVSKHSSIFVPPWFERRGGEIVTNRQLDLVLVDHVPSDHAFASWLFRRFSAAGYSVWCNGLAPLSGENADASVRTLIRLRAVAYLPVLSSKSLSDIEFAGRIAVAADRVRTTVPCWLSDLNDRNFHSKLAALTPARFDKSWKSGLESLARQIENVGVVKSIEKDVGRAIALRAYQAEPLLRDRPEQVLSNSFAATVPEAIRVYDRPRHRTPLDPELSQQWAYIERGGKLFSFSNPPNRLPALDKEPAQFAWRYFELYDNMDSVNLAKELVKKSLMVASYRAGFRWCDARKTLFLQEPERKRHPYQDTDERLTSISFTGERTWRSGSVTSKFRYQLGPVFRITFDENLAVWVTVRFYVRLTDDRGEVLSRSMIPSRRKRVTKGWWNRQWLQRTLGVMQLLAGEANIHGQIVIGKGNQEIRVDVAPLIWECPISIDVEALDRVGDFQAELASARQIIDNSELGAAEDG